jgi:hypothetical protein
MDGAPRQSVETLDLSQVINPARTKADMGVPIALRAA